MPQNLKPHRQACILVTFQMTILVSLYLEGTVFVVGDYNRETHTQIRITNLCLFPLNVVFFLQATKMVHSNFMSLYSEWHIFKVKLTFMNERLYLAELIMRRLIFEFPTVTYRSYRIFFFYFRNN